MYLASEVGLAVAVNTVSPVGRHLDLLVPRRSGVAVTCGPRWGAWAALALTTGTLLTRWPPGAPTQSTDVVEAEQRAR